MSEKRKHEPSPDENLIMQGLVSRIINEAGRGNNDRTILDIALQIKTDALKEFGNELDKHAKFLQACDTVIGYVRSNPNKTVLDMFRENPKKP